MVANSPGLIAGSNVLHRLLVPRHPPIALSSLSQQQNHKTLQRDARVHYTVLKIRAGTPAPSPPHTDKEHHPGKQHTHQMNPTSSLVRAGPSHPSNHHWLNRDPRRNRTNPRRTLSRSWARFLRTQQRASTHHLRLTHVPHSQGVVLATSTRIQA